EHRHRQVIAIDVELVLAAITFRSTCSTERQEKTQTCRSSSFEAAIRRNTCRGDSCRSLRPGDVGA
ncbi:MAG TPA: hypothetical protein PKZ27_16835, partial [Rhodocyclaceae bacterium]|nr:hypothetical protein [Rhodocyclaceae bacterium]